MFRITVRIVPAPSFRILVVGDHPVVLTGLRLVLDGNRRYALIGAARDGRSACAAIERAHAAQQEPIATLVRADIREQRVAAVRCIGPQAEAADVPVRLSTPETPLCVNFDAAALEQILDNLLSNAVRFSGDSGWCEKLHLREIFPDARQILLGNSNEGGDQHFDPKFDRRSFEQAMQSVSKNAIQALAYAMANSIVEPTPSKTSLFLPIFRP